MPDVDPELVFILKWFFEVKGANPLSYQEIEAWQKLKSIDIEPGEVEILMMLDCDFYEMKKNGSH